VLKLSTVEAKSSAFYAFKVEVSFSLSGTCSLSCSSRGLDPPAAGFVLVITILAHCLEVSLSGLLAHLSLQWPQSLQCP
jgi:hypothetical protein